MKFVFMYYNGNAIDGSTQEEVMQEWGKWMEDLGEKLVDSGNPFNSGAQSVTKAGVSELEEGDNYSVGYSIVEATGMDEAVKIAQSNPMHKHSEGKAVIKVYEAMPM